MYAIVDIAGQQFKVEKEQEIFVNRLDGKEETNVSFDKVLLIDNDGKIAVGNPVIKGATVSAKILEHLKAEKIIVFKKKRRKGYKTLNGHRQLLTKIQIEKISDKGGAKAAEKVTVKKETVESKPKTAAKKAAPKKTTTAKATTKKPAAKKAAKKEDK